MKQCKGHILLDNTTVFYIWPTGRTYNEDLKRSAFCPSTSYYHPSISAARAARNVFILFATKILSVRRGLDWDFFATKTLSVWRGLDWCFFATKTLSVRRGLDEEINRREYHRKAFNGEHSRIMQLTWGMPAGMKKKQNLERRWRLLGPR